MNKNNSEDMEAIDVLVKNIVKAINKHTTKADRTFISVITQVNSNGTYVIRDEEGADRTVRCAVLVELSVGKNVWVKVPCGNVGKMHICGVV